MASFFNYKILPEQRIFLQYFKGTINFDITIAGMSKVVQDNEFDSSFNSIVDFRGAHFQYTDNDIIKFREFLKIKNLVDNQRRVAFLTNTPNQVVLLTLFSINKDNSKVNYNIFSTIESATSWLPLDKISELLIQKELKKLKK